jgi:hypothetical protein
MGSVLGCISAMTGWPGSGATKTFPAPHEFRNYPCRLWGCGQAGGGGLGAATLGGDLVGGGGITEGAAGLRLLSQCRRCGGHIDSSMYASVAENLGGHPSRCSSSALRQQMCSRADTSEYAYVAPTWGIPPSAPAVHSDIGAVAVAGRSWSLRTSSTRAPDGCARLARRPSSEGSRIHAAGPSVCGTSRACT